MIRRLATTLAATSALVLTATAPALATHDDPEPLVTYDGNLRHCHDLLIKEIPEFFEYGDQLFQGEFSGWNTDEEKNKVDPPEDWTEDGWWEATLELDGVYLDVKVEDGVQVVVIVKGGQNGSNVFLNSPGDDLLDVYAPANDNDEHPEISHYAICKLSKDDTPPPDDNGDDGDDGDKDEDGKDKETSSPSPTPTTTPAAVPTAVPAGSAGSDGGSMAPIGIVAAALMMLAGGAALLRRRFAHQN